MSRYRQNDIISVMFNDYSSRHSFFRIRRVTKTFYEVDAVDIETWQNDRKAFIINNADVDPKIKLHKRDIAWPFRNL